MGHKGYDIWTLTQKNSSDISADEKRTQKRKVDRQVFQDCKAHANV